tara:strand:+ start:332 stop:619 length:288 start_codon:yes stop_codon:yes gene_type:complete
MSEQENEMTMIEKLSEELGEKELKIMEQEKEIKSLKKDILKIAVERNYFKEVIENNDILQCEVCNIYQNEEDSIYMIELGDGTFQCESCFYKTDG